MMNFTHKYTINQIVKGINAGVFVILGFRTVNGIYGVQVKEVSPEDHSKVAPCELFFPIDAIKPFNS